MSNYSSEAAEQIMRISLEGTEVALKLVGSGAKQLTILLYAALNGQKRSRGKTRLMSLLKSGKALKVFALKDSELDLFRKEAKKYGILFTMLKDNTVNDGITDIMVKAEDASRVNYIFERFKLATVEMGSVLQDVDKAIEERTENENKILTNDEKTDAFLEKVIAGSGETRKVNPTQARDGEPDPQSMNLKAQKSKPEEAAKDTAAKRPVKEELEEIKAEMSEKEKSAAKTKTRSRAKQAKVKEAR